MLRKAKRDLARLQDALNLVDDEAASDALFDFGVSISSIRDWLVEHSSTTFSRADVDAMAKTPALEVFRDIANGSKHRNIKKYEPDTLEVLTSAPSSREVVEFLGEDSVLNLTAPKLKAVTKDGYRHQVLQLATEALGMWEKFMDRHGV
jgi:hypothetical protein